MVPDHDPVCGQGDGGVDVAVGVEVGVDVGGGGRDDGDQFFITMGR